MNGLVSTSNTRRIVAALAEIEQRLTDREVLGLGLVYGEPGRGKTATTEAYHAQRNGEGDIQCYWVTAAPTWRTLHAMLLDLTEAVGVRDPKRRSSHDLFKSLEDYLKRNPGIILIDEADSFVGHRTQVEVLKQLHDRTQCGFLLVGEPRSRLILKNYVSFDSRLNESAVIEVQNHTLADIAAVISSRCEFSVDEDVCREIHRTCGSSMRLVIKRCREMRAFVEANGLTGIGMAEYRTMSGEQLRQRAVPAGSGSLAAVAGGQ